MNANVLMQKKKRADAAEARADKYEKMLRELGKL